MKTLKSQIEHAQHLVEKSQVKLQKDFDNWWIEQCEIMEQKQNQREINNSSSILLKASDSIASSIASTSTNSRLNSSLNTTVQVIYLLIEKIRKKNIKK